LKLHADSRLRLDKNLFQAGLLKLQAKVDERFYTTTLAFAHDLCDVINIGINTEPELAPEPQPKFESVVVPPTKIDFSDHRDRKKLGKRILRSVQQQLETVLRLEVNITHKPFETLKQELEGMVEASIELRRNTANASLEAEDVIMVDASNEEITVGDPADDNDAPEDQETDITMAEAEREKPKYEGSIEVNTSGLEEDDEAKAEGAPSAIGSAAGQAEETSGGKAEGALPNGNDSLDTPPATNGYVAAPHSSQPGPPTPPQSNGSLDREQTNALADGGIPWYLKGFDPEGTSAVLEQWSGRDAVRSLSEELTEMDEDELKGLGVDFNEGSITASPVSTNTAEASGTIGSAKKNTKAKKRKAPFRRR
jgi:NuA3 HAT complex component NTO1